MEIYVVSWAAIVPSDVEGLRSGILSGLFLTKKAARKAVMDDIRALAKVDLDKYDKADRMDALGADTPAALAKKMIRLDDGHYIESVSECGMVTQYTIVKFDTDFAT